MRSGLLGKQEATTFWSAEGKRGADEQRLIMWVEIGVLAGVAGSGVSRAGFCQEGWGKIKARLSLHPHHQPPTPLWNGQKSSPPHPLSNAHTCSVPAAPSTGIHWAQSISWKVLWKLRQQTGNRHSTSSPGKETWMATNCTLLIPTLHSFRS